MKDPNLVRGEALFADGRVDEAREAFLHAAAEGPSQKEALNNLGVLAFQGGDTAQAAEYFKKTLLQAPGYITAASNLVDALDAEGRTEASIPFLERLRDRHPQHAELDTLIGQVYDLQRSEPDDEQTSAGTMPAAVFNPTPGPRAQALLTDGARHLEDGRLDAARVSLERAARILNYTSDAVVRRLSKVYQLQDDVPAQKELWKRVAVCALDRGDHEQFLHWSYVSIYAEQMFSPNANYRFATIDWDLHAHTRHLARQLPLRQWIAERRQNRLASGRPERLRIGFVLEGFSDVQAPIRCYMPIPAHYDPRCYELFFYSRHDHAQPNAIRENYEQVATRLRDQGCTVRHPKTPLSLMGQVEFLAQQIVQDGVDALVFQTAYFVPAYNLLANLRPAPVQLSVDHQQCEHHPEIELVYTTPKIGLDAHAYAAPAFNPQTRSSVTTGQLTRADFGIPDDAIVSLSAARAQRYRQPAFWSELLAYLGRHPNAWYVALGLDSLDGLVPDDHPARDRILTPGFRSDVMQILALGDVYINLFPSGGGSSVVEACQQGLATVCFKEDFATHYYLPRDGYAWSLLGDPDVVIPFGDLPRWHTVMDRLTTDESFRKEKGASVKAGAACTAPDRQVRMFFTELEALWRSRVVAART